MDGKRFGAGLAAGLLVALAIVGASGFAGSTLTASLSYSSAPATSAETSTTTVTTTSVSTIPAYVASATSTTSSGTYTAGTSTPTNGTGSNVNALTTTSESSSVTSSNPQGYTFGTVAQNAAENSPSNVKNLATQPVLSTAFVVLPVLVALLLGALLYRVSVGAKDKDSEEELEG